jgi:hypothetical protein
MHDERLKMPTQNTNGVARCYCGTEITIESVDTHIQDGETAPPRARRFGGYAREAPEQMTETIMRDDIATTARLMKIVEAAVDEFERQGVAEALSNLNFDPMALARAVIKAADGDVVQFPGSPRGH